MATLEPLRGEVWDVRFPSFGEQPAVVLSVTPLNMRLGHVAVIPITGSYGPASTHVKLTGDVALTGHEEAYADITGLQPAERSRFRRQRGQVLASDLVQLEDRLRVYLSL